MWRSPGPQVLWRALAGHWRGPHGYLCSAPHLLRRMDNPVSEEPDHRYYRLTPPYVGGHANADGGFDGPARNRVDVRVWCVLVMVGMVVASRRCCTCQYGRVKKYLQRLYGQHLDRSKPAFASRR
jgi:hypothetical protein